MRLKNLSRKQTEHSPRCRSRRMERGGARSMRVRRPNDTGAAVRCRSHRQRWQQLTRPSAERSRRSVRRCVERDEIQVGAELETTRGEQRQLGYGVQAVKALAFTPGRRLTTTNGHSNG